ncbi:hypothetical protein EPICR_130002 [Candidatus Desulfarcum epimagneticum]|uniref:Uncharacterized protein n=1 Tax=uncultured Desulfobacteraceae bacterium TaxID=218296 RepID=A0A484HJ25_9BACT|nr:hypothetical protein EPICR_130002 [uncultured Desulfobacteraceae bacterium]
MIGEYSFDQPLHAGSKLDDIVKKRAAVFFVRSAYYDNIWQASEKGHDVFSKNKRRMLKCPVCQ